MHRAVLPTIARHFVNIGRTQFTQHILTLHQNDVVRFNFVVNNSDDSYLSDNMLIVSASWVFAYLCQWAQLTRSNWQQLWAPLFAKGRSTVCSYFILHPSCCMGWVDVAHCWCRVISQVWNTVWKCQYITARDAYLGAWLTRVTDSQYATHLRDVTSTCRLT